MAESRRIVITGASSGIGAALCRELAAAGHQIYACARRQERLDALAEKDERIRALECDVSNAEQVVRFVDWVSEHADGIDVLICAAGRFGAIGRMWETDSDQWFSTIGTNLFGTYLVIKHTMPLLQRSSDARIVNFAGGGAFSPFPNYTAYAVSKAAVVRLTETLAQELASEGVAVNAVAPGFVATEIHEATLVAGDRAGDEHLEATRRNIERGGGVPMHMPVDCVKFLISEGARGLTGKTLSASFDPWDTRAFREHIPALNESELYTQARINLVHLSDGDLKESLVAASAARQRGN